MNFNEKLKNEFGIALTIIKEVFGMVLTPFSELHSPEFGIELTKKRAQIPF